VNAAQEKEGWAEQLASEASQNWVKRTFLYQLRQFLPILHLDTYVMMLE